MKKEGNKPRIRAFAAITLDGKIARHEREHVDWTSPEDKEFFQSQLDGSDVAVLGNNTYQTLPRPATERNRIVFTRSIADQKREGDHLLYVNPTGTDVAALLASYDNVAVCGGGAVYAWFIQHDLLDEFYLTIEPVVFGTGISLFGEGKVDFNLQLAEVKQLNEWGTVLLVYKKVISKE